MPTDLARPLCETRFQAMGTDVHVAIVDGDVAMLDLAEARIGELERRWSRVIDDSEINVLNRHAGHPVVVSTDTFELVARATEAWKMTGGRFDPTVGTALVAHGYDRDFREVATTIATATPTKPAPGPSGIELLPHVAAVTLPEGVMFDPGGIGKGLAADFVTAELLDAGARGALMNVGGDLRAAGQPPTREGWVITVPDPLDPRRELLRLALPAGAVATSSRVKRRWRTTAGEAHHLIDPRAGRPATTDVVAVSVVAGEGWWAEAQAKALFLAGPRGLQEMDVHAVVVTSDGARHATPDLEVTLR
jgi:thiamine biosynthesis lipoprotein